MEVLAAERVSVTRRWLSPERLKDSHGQIGSQGRQQSESVTLLGNHCHEL